MASSELHVKDDREDLIFGSGSVPETSSSSTAGFRTSCRSELRLTGTETESEEDEGREEDFIAELTRQMADYMLQDDEEEYEVPQERFSKFIQPSVWGHEGKWCNCNGKPMCYYDNRELLESDSADPTNFMFNYSMRPIEVYKLKNQPSVKEQGIASRGRRSDPTQRRKTQVKKSQGRRSGGKGNVKKDESGTQAIFMGVKGSHGGGTGVFLPRGINQRPTEPMKKSDGRRKGSVHSIETHHQLQPTNEIALPEEWTY